MAKPPCPYDQQPKISATEIHNLPPKDNPMANPEHVTKAGYAIAGFNKWRDEHPEIAPDLSGADLSAGLYRRGKLFGANLVGTDYRKSNLVEADFHDSNISKSDLRKCDIRKANFDNANLTGARLGKSNLAGATLRNADLSGADLEQVHLGGADLTGAKLTGAKLTQTDFETAIGLTSEQVAEAIGDKSTMLPKGMARPASWTPASASEQ
tara:strand:+ start:1713 stop:2342 length:630 start_codon:yes stop_codon:yes gene_type:complete